MPLYDYFCRYCDSVRTEFRHIADRDDAPACHDARMVRMLSRPMVFVSRDICYDSPIDGRPITNKQARIEDFARSGCVEYDPGVKQDAERRRAQSEQDLDRKVDAFVESEFERMPARKKERLAAELESGADVQIARQTPPQTSFKELGNG